MLGGVETQTPKYDRARVVIWRGSSDLNSALSEFVFRTSATCHARRYVKFVTRKSCWPC
jgi:hypothetical protein